MSEHAAKMPDSSAARLAVECSQLRLELRDAREERDRLRRALDAVLDELPLHLRREAIRTLRAPQ